MLAQLASVFSSQGVVLPGTERVAFPARPNGAPPRPSEFPAHFEQAATRLELSASGLKAAEEAGNPGNGGEEGNGGTPAGDSARAVPGGKALTEEEKKQVEDLKQRDREVRAHEQAHLAASGGNAKGGAQFEYQSGPDGRRYAVGGHVNIEMSSVPGNPRATLQKAMAVRSAATAPAEPSGADLSVAAAAARMAAQARSELAKDATGRGPEAGGRSSEAAGHGSEAGDQGAEAAGHSSEADGRGAVSAGRRAYSQAAQTGSAPGRAINLIA